MQTLIMSHTVQTHRAASVTGLRRGRKRRRRKREEKEEEEEEEEEEKREVERGSHTCQSLSWCLHKD